MSTPRKSAAQPTPTGSSARPGAEPPANGAEREAQHGRERGSRSRRRRGARRAARRQGRRPRAGPRSAAMRVARTRGGEAREQGDDDAQRERDDRRCAPRTPSRPAGRSMPSAVEQRAQALGERDAEHRGRRRRRTRRSPAPSVSTERMIWRRDAPSVRRVASSRDALGERDRQRVEDHEGAHAQRDDAEAEQEVLDELMIVLGVLGVGVGLLRRRS